MFSRSVSASRRRHRGTRTSTGAVTRAPQAGRDSGTHRQGPLLAVAATGCEAVNRCRRPQSPERDLSARGRPPSWSSYSFASINNGQRRGHSLSAYEPKYDSVRMYAVPAAMSRIFLRLCRPLPELQYRLISTRRRKLGSKKAPVRKEFNISPPILSEWALEYSPRCRRIIHCLHRQAGWDYVSSSQAHGTPPSRGMKRLRVNVAGPGWLSTPIVVPAGVPGRGRPEACRVEQTTLLNCPSPRGHPSGSW